MIYLRTGANGSGKTLLTLRDVREKSLKESRPVYHNGRFELIGPGLDFGWQKIDFKDWQSVPDGAIFIIDECHNELPVRVTKEVPDYIRMLAEHRRRGFDFFLITQHPMNIDSFVRRLIGSPGWHQHLKRASGAPLVSVLEWASVREDCHKAGAGSTGSVSMVPFPKEVFTWYQSTSLNTAKIKIPFQVKVLAFTVVALPLSIYGAYYAFQHNRALSGKPPVESAPAGGLVGGSRVAAPAAPSSPAEAEARYLENYRPRFGGLAYTASRYDDITKPTVAPAPAGCIASGDKCTCYTDQGTKTPADHQVCLQIVEHGFFKDWGGVGAPGARPVAPMGAAVPGQSVPVSVAPYSVDFGGHRVSPS